MVDLGIAIANDSAVFDQVHVVTFVPRGQSGIVVPEVIQSSLVHGSNESLGSVALEIDRRTFSLPLAHCNGHEPQPGDTIQDDGGVTWRIVSVQRATIDTRFICACTRVF